jgi:dihydroorotase
MNLLIKSATIVDKDSDLHFQKKDILIEDGIIKTISDHIEGSNFECIDLPNLHISKGWFDSSVSFGEPGFEERETLKNGLATCKKSGFTSVISTPNTDPIIDQSTGIEFIKNFAKHHIVNLFPMGALTRNSDLKHIAELYDMKSKGAVCFGDYKKCISDANLFKIALQYSNTIDALIQVYPNDVNLTENAQIHEGTVSTALGLKGFPKMAEVIQLQKDLEILKYTNTKLHFAYISTAESVDLIRKAKANGLDVSCSVVLSNLAYTDEKLSEFDSKYKVMPPLRETEDVEALKAGLADGTIDMVTTDHNPLNIELKKTEFENAEFGSIGLESSFGILNSIFELEDAIAYLTKGRNRFKIREHQIKEGEFAELTLFNPDVEWVLEEKDIKSKSKNAIFLGEKHKGKAYGIINNNDYYVSE